MQIGIEELTDLIVERLGGDSPLVYAHREYNEEGEGVNERCTSTASMIHELIEEGVDPDKILSVGHLMEIYQGRDDSIIWMMTQDEYREQENERLRYSLEKGASQLAKEFGHSVGTFGFIKGLEALIEGVEAQQEQWNSGERRMEEWAGCVAAGCSNSYFDDLNFENGRYAARIDRYYEMMEWLREECPLLMCKWEEMKLEKEVL